METIRVSRRPVIQSSLENRPAPDLARGRRHLVEHRQHLRRGRRNVPLARDQPRTDAGGGLDGLLFPHARHARRRSFEGIHTKASTGNCFMMWLTLAGPDVGEMLTWKVPHESRGATSSSRSSRSRNNDPPSGRLGHIRATGRNSTQSGNAITLLLHNLFLLAFKRKELGCVMVAEPSGPEHVAARRDDLPLVAPRRDRPSALVGGFPRLACSARRSHATRDFGSVGTKMWWAIPQAVLAGPRSGSTCRTRARPRAANTRRSPAAPTPGYQPKATSPYKMPFDPAAVSTWLHRPGESGPLEPQPSTTTSGRSTPTTSSLDHGDEILAARSGTVIQFSESIPDTENPALGRPRLEAGDRRSRAGLASRRTIDVVDGSVFADVGLGSSSAARGGGHRLLHLESPGQHAPGRDSGRGGKHDPRPYAATTDKVHADDSSAGTSSSSSHDRRRGLLPRLAAAARTRPRSRRGRRSRTVSVYGQRPARGASAPPFATHKPGPCRSTPIRRGRR